VLGSSDHLENTEEMFKFTVRSLRLYHGKSEHILRHCWENRCHLFLWRIIQRNGNTLFW